MGDCIPLIKRNRRKVWREQKNRGFTLIEMLIVLGIMSFLLLLTPLISAVDTEEIAFRFFLEDFLSQLENAQNYAVVTGKGVKISAVEVRKGKSEITFLTETGSTAFIDRKLEAPEGVSLAQNKDFWIKRDSGYTTVNSFIFLNGQYRTSVKIQLGSGRYHIEKTKK